TKHVWDAPQTAEVLQMVEVTLKRMAYGGIFDHLAGGFSRYSVDARWLVPHFEKMLYDNAQLARAFVHTWRLTDNAFYARMCEKTLDYLLACLRDSGGGFHSTEDADSEGEEGKFYVWTPEEVIDVLGEDAGTRFCQLYDVTPSGNFEGRNIINLPLSFADFAERHQLDKTALMTEMRDSRKKLLEVRDRRIRPGLDDKVLASWNGLAIEAFADAAVLLERADYAEAAQQAGDFIWDHMRQADGRLLHSSRHGQASLTAYLDDYACLIN
ncbi:MAG: thioredoxin domain-containing protein, partial [Planctomycetaceae bacterium]|nr:thioredoxin domain-containing protein [Planctomycetaceae bacterium]